tara:strand:- start:777 stop:1052 length:276 start_codon:yes stop_codon:yes gene_type:complete
MQNFLNLFLLPFFGVLLVISNFSCSYKSKDSNLKNYEEAAKIITNTYKNLLTREPDQSGLENYTKLLMEGTSIKNIENDIRNSDEFKLLQK